ncbi:hypothetical protein HD593_004648 [Nonomuraea rubra]|uniref:Uncharacterized protein n=1 Tax=Nonomuraea rubra TaxID=46180 RepID=A0A7X0TZT8_9ACTN|nr:hypothetical protein [Nonomuraea rubra]
MRRIRVSKPTKKPAPTQLDLRTPSGRKLPF